MIDATMLEMNKMQKN